MTRTITVKAQNLRLGDWVVTLPTGLLDHGEVVSMSQMASLPSGRYWDIGLQAGRESSLVVLSDGDRVRVERETP